MTEKIVLPYDEHATVRMQQLDIHHIYHAPVSIKTVLIVCLTIQSISIMVLVLFLLYFCSIIPIVALLHGGQEHICVATITKAQTTLPITLHCQ
jgi:hypothetical protein